MRGYWEDPGQTREAVDESGWMHTGDLGTIDVEGYCNITEFLYRDPKVQAVQVFGVPDHRYDEEVCAWIRLRAGKGETEEHIREFCRGQIAHQEVPRYIRFVTEFPMRVTGKVQKFLMRERMIRELNLKVERTA